MADIYYKKLVKVTNTLYPEEYSVIKNFQTIYRLKSKVHEEIFLLNAEKNTPILFVIMGFEQKISKQRSLNCNVCGNYGNFLSVYLTRNRELADNNITKDFIESHKEDIAYFYNKFPLNIHCMCKNNELFRKDKLALEKLCARKRQRLI